MSPRGVRAAPAALTAMLAMHTASPLPQQMSFQDMAATMQMDDTARFGGVRVDQLEWRSAPTGEPDAAWDAEAWYGGDYDKLWVKTEGGYAAGPGGLRNTSVDLLWNRVVSPWWNVQAGLRQDLAQGQSRSWVALGLQGLAPQWVETEVTLYASDEGRTAARLKVQYELLLTQRLILEPFAEANLYGRPDPQRQMGSGLAEAELSARLRFEVRRDIGPYVGLVWLRNFGGTAERLRAAGASAGAVEWTLGLHAAF